MRPMMLSMYSVFTAIFAALVVFQAASAFVVSPKGPSRVVFQMSKDNETPKKDDVLDAAIAAMFSSSGEQLGPESVQGRIRSLVESNDILLFMKGTKEFPQCGFSDTATKILERYGKDYHAVDVLADEAIRQGVKIYSDWPTIPQLYVKGEFIGGSDIMLQMFESGELEKLIEEATSS